MISVIIPAYNEEKSILKCLDSLNRQKTSKEFEIIVVNNVSTDKTAEVINAYKTKVPIRIIDDPVKGRGHARYTGFANATGDIIFSTDSDTELPENWLEKLSSYFENTAVVGVTSQAKVTDLSTVSNFIFNYAHLAIILIYKLVTGHYWFNGFSFAVRKDAYFKAGQFNPILNTEEDVDLSNRVAKMGKIKFAREVPVVFSSRRFKRGVFIGLAEYIIGYAVYLFGNKAKADLSDIR